MGIVVACTNCGKKGSLLFRDEHELRVPYNWSTCTKDIGNEEEFELLCNEKGCWDKYSS